ncbi:MAG: DUF3991 domain-containing protein [Dehalococcoidia bacterium]|nr:MAG: DUF3991 domain-containing protein [Dehalococcoidia bacterium]
MGILPQKRQPDGRPHRPAHRKQPRHQHERLQEPSAQTRLRTMTFQQRRELAHRLRAIPLERVLALCGAQIDRYDRRKWHTPAGVLSLTGAKFINWNLGTGGGGAIDLVIHLFHLDFKGAVDWLVGHFPGAIPPSPVIAVPQSGLRLPPPDRSRLGQVKRYLVCRRSIPAALLQPLLQSGSLYADARANAVFLLRDQQGLPVGAELRGTTGELWRGLAPGSQKDLGCFSIPAEPRPSLILCESAIDALSCFALHPGYRCLSTAGARPNPRWLQLLLDQGCQVYCGFDADPTGDAMACALITLHPTVQRLRPSQHDWNDVLKAHA